MGVFAVNVGEEKPHLGNRRVAVLSRLLIIKLIPKTKDIYKISIYMKTVLFMSMNYGRDMKMHTSASKINLYPIMTQDILNLHCSNSYQSKIHLPVSEKI